MRNFYAGIFIFCLMLLFSCKTSSKDSKNNLQNGNENSMNSLDWDGIYRGVLPCADCAGMQTTITLNKDLTYVTKIKYLGKSDSVFESSGKFEWNKQGSIIALYDAQQNQTAK